ncbi:MAG TPA: uracil-DNA glycosylase [Luteibaculaceae bacterium]|nr:uracil-DNA glycosylase [Luteibaculaceae bacterium]
MRSELIPAAWARMLDREGVEDKWIEINGLLNNHPSALRAPADEQLFRSLSFFGPSQTKVILIGQDPYHGLGQANGLAFAVNPGVSFPPSLRNIFKELKRSLNVDVPWSGDLHHWAQQGVLLLNTSLSVEIGKPASHSNWGWQVITDAILREALETSPSCVVMLWGSHAIQKEKWVDQSRHLVLKSPHPSPLSAHRGFLGNNHFALANQWLVEKKMEPIRW